MLYVYVYIDILNNNALRLIIASYKRGIKLKDISIFFRLSQSTFSTIIKNFKKYGRIDKVVTDGDKRSILTEEKKNKS